MNHPQRLFRRAALLALGATLLLAVPAAAHPFVQGGEAPIDSRAELTLQMAHGCLAEDQPDAGDGESAGEGENTTEVAMQVPPSVRILDAPEADGYEPAFERADDGRIEVVTWTATGGGEPAPDLPFDAVIEGEVGSELYLKVFQACEDFTYRWVGTPDEPADDPAIRITLAAADPDSPAPAPGDAPAEAEVNDAPDDGAESEAGTEEEGGIDAEAAPDAGTEVGEEATGSDGSASDAQDPADAEATGDDAAAAADEGGGSALPWVIAGLVAIALVAGVVPFVLRRRVADDDYASA